MKLTTSKEKIVNGVLIAERIVGKKESLPVLSCVLIDAGKTLSLRATNLEAGIEVYIPCDIEKKGITVLRERLLRGISAVAYAASPSMIRPELGSVYVSIKSAEVTSVATDSFRLAEKTIGGGKGSGSTEVLIPLKHAQELAHVLERAEDENVELSADEAQLTVSASGVRFISRVVDGTFPNYKEIIPKTFAAEATVLKNDFA